MAKKLGTPLDFNQLEIQNAVFQLLGSNPGSPVEGQFFYNSGTNKLTIYNGSGWDTLTVSGSIVNSDIDASAAIALSKLATDPLARANHTGTQTASTISDFGTTVLAYRLDQFAAPTTSVSLNSQKITNLATPTASTDAATKAYVDGVVQGLDIKASVRAASTANLTLSGEQTIDGVAVVTGDRVLVKDQSTASQNGIYVADTGSWSRSTDADSSSEVNSGMYAYVEEGTVNGSTSWVLATANPITLGSTSLSFAQFSGGADVTAGDALTLTGTILDVNVDNTTIEVNGSNQLAIDAAYTGQTSITTLGTVTTGTWSATAIAVAKGGTGATDASTARSNLGVPGKYSTTVGNGSSTSYTVTHNLGTRDCVVSVYESASPYAEIITDVEHTTTNTLTVSFAVAPSSGQYTVAVIG